MNSLWTAQFKPSSLLMSHSTPKVRSLHTMDGKTGRIKIFCFTFHQNLPRLRYTWGALDQLLTPCRASPVHIRTGYWNSVSDRVVSVRVNVKWEIVPSMRADLSSRLMRCAALRHFSVICSRCRKCPPEDELKSIIRRLLSWASFLARWDSLSQWASGCYFNLPADFQSSDGRAEWGIDGDEGKIPTKFKTWHKNASKRGCLWVQLNAKLRSSDFKTSLADDVCFWSRRVGLFDIPVLVNPNPLRIPKNFWLARAQSAQSD